MNLRVSQMFLFGFEKGCILLYLGLNSWNIHAVEEMSKIIVTTYTIPFISV